MWTNWRIIAPFLGASGVVAASTLPKRWTRVQFPAGAQSYLFSYSIRKNLRKNCEKTPRTRELCPRSRMGAEVKVSLLSFNLLAPCYFRQPEPLVREDQTC